MWLISYLIGYSIFGSYFNIEENKCFPLKTILKNEAPSSLTTILNKPLKQIFPFLFDPKYYTKIKDEKPDPEMKYTVLKIVKNNITVGYMFIRLFYGMAIKTSYSKYCPKRGETKPRQTKEDKVFYKEVSREYIYCIYLIGEKDYIKGLETMFNTNSQKVQQSAFGIEIDKHSFK